MKRSFLLVAACLMVLASAAEAVAQTRVALRFASTQHDFGTLPRGAPAEHLFWFTNASGSDVRIHGVRSSCGCTTASVVHSIVKNGERGAIRAVFNTRSFAGHQASTITVVFDWPRYSEVQLEVRGYIRSDVVFRPGSADFGTVRQGQPVEQVIGVEYAGRDNWRIAAIRVPASYFHVEAQETRRDSGRVSYQLTLRLAEDAPPGPIETELTLQTDDSRGNRVPLTLRGQVVPPLSVSPALLYLGETPHGTQRRMRLVVRAAESFRITGVECDDPRFQFEVAAEAKSLHFIPVIFQAAGDAGPLNTAIRISTDLSGANTAEVTASGTVLP